MVRWKIKKKLLFYILLNFTWKNVFSTNPTKTPVNLDLKSKNTTDKYQYSKENNLGIYTAKSKHVFNKVKTDNDVIWETSNENEYAVKVVRDGVGLFSSINNVTITLTNGSKREFTKSGNRWVEKPAQTQTKSNPTVGQSTTTSTDVTKTTDDTKSTDLDQNRSSDTSHSESIPHPAGSTEDDTSGSQVTELGEAGETGVSRSQDDDSNKQDVTESTEEYGTQSTDVIGTKEADSGVSDPTSSQDEENSSKLPSFNDGTEITPSIVTPGSNQHDQPSESPSHSRSSTQLKSLRIVLTAGQSSNGFSDHNELDQGTQSTQSINKQSGDDVPTAFTKSLAQLGESDQSTSKTDVTQSGGPSNQNFEKSKGLNNKTNELYNKVERGSEELKTDLKSLTFRLLTSSAKLARSANQQLTSSNNNDLTSDYNVVKTSYQQLKDKYDSGNSKYNSVKDQFEAVEKAFNDLKQSFGDTGSSSISVPPLPFTQTQDSTGPNQNPTQQSSTDVTDSAEPDQLGQSSENGCKLDPHKPGSETA